LETKIDRRVVEPQSYPHPTCPHNQGLLHPELPPVLRGSVVSGPLPLRRLALSAFVLYGTREWEFGDFGMPNKGGSNGGREIGVGILGHLSQTHSSLMNG
jgi:hypothetical protein